MSVSKKMKVKFIVNILFIDHSNKNNSKVPSEKYLNIYLIKEGEFEVSGTRDSILKKDYVNEYQKVVVKRNRKTCHSKSLSYDTSIDKNDQTNPNKYSEYSHMHMK